MQELYRVIKFEENTDTTKPVYVIRKAVGWWRPTQWIRAYRLERTNKSGLKVHLVEGIEVATKGFAELALYYAQTKFPDVTFMLERVNWPKRDKKRYIPLWIRKPLYQVQFNGEVNSDWVDWPTKPNKASTVRILAKKLSYHHPHNSQLVVRDTSRS